MTGPLAWSPREAGRAAAPSPFPLIGIGHRTAHYCTEILNLCMVAMSLSELQAKIAVLDRHPLILVAQNLKHDLLNLAPPKLYLIPSPAGNRLASVV